MSSATDSLRCPLCLLLCSDPVTVPCGHSFCRSCLSSHWSQSCPQCGFSFSPTLAFSIDPELVQGLGAVSLNPAPSAPPLDFQHATFDISSVRFQRNDGEHLLGETRRNLSQQIIQKETERRQLQQAMKDFHRDVKAVLKDSSRIFSELQEFLEQRRLEVKELIRAHEKAEVTRAENQLQRLEQEVSALRGREAELQKFRQSEDPQFISQMCGSVLCPTSVCSPVVNPHVSFGSVRKALMDLKQQLESVCLMGLPTVSVAVTSVTMLQMQPPEYKGVCESTPLPALDNRDALLQYLRPVSVDPFSAHRELSLSKGSRVVSRRGELHSYPDHHERFECWVQALSHEGLMGRSYWEAEWEGGQVAMGLSYHSIGRKDMSNKSRLGYNADSWCLKCSESSFSFCHGAREQQVVVPQSTMSRRIAVFLDHDQGLLCFFTVAGKRLHPVHKLEVCFTQPLYAAVWLGSNSSISFCEKN